MKLIKRIRQILFKKRYDKSFKRDCVECSFRRYFLVSNKLNDISFCVQDVDNMLRYFYKEVEEPTFELGVPIHLIRQIYVEKSKHNDMVRACKGKHICSICPYKAFFNMNESCENMKQYQIQYLYKELVDKTDYTTASHIDEYINKINNNLTVL